MEQLRNATAGKWEIPTQNPPTSGIVQHDSHIRKPGSNSAGNRTRFAYVEDQRTQRRHGVTFPLVSANSFSDWLREAVEVDLASDCLLRYKIDVKHVYTEVTLAIGSQFIRPALDDSEPIADLQGNNHKAVLFRRFRSSFQRILLQSLPRSMKSFPLSYTSGSWRVTFFVPFVVISSVFQGKWALLILFTCPDRVSLATSNSAPFARYRHKGIGKFCDFNDLLARLHSPVYPRATDNCSLAVALESSQCYPTPGSMALATCFLASLLLAQSHSGTGAVVAKISHEIVNHRNPLHWPVNGDNAADIGQCSPWAGSFVVGPLEREDGYVRASISAILISLRNHEQVGSLLASLQGEKGLIPDRVTPRFSHVRIVSVDATGWRVFSGISHYPHPCIPEMLHTHLASPKIVSQEPERMCKIHVTTEIVQQACCEMYPISCATGWQVILQGADWRTACRHFVGQRCHFNSVCVWSWRNMWLFHLCIVIYSVPVKLRNPVFTTRGSWLVVLVVPISPPIKLLQATATTTLSPACSDVEPHAHEHCIPARLLFCTHVCFYCCALLRRLSKDGSQEVVLRERLLIGLARMLTTHTTIFHPFMARAPPGAVKRGSDKGDPDMNAQCPIAPIHKVLNWGAMFLWCCLYLWDLQRTRQNLRHITIEQIRTQMLNATMLSLTLSCQSSDWLREDLEMNFMAD
ncbi:hypothetical protein PR048_018059 [Dryococelus australis]|uniref:Uncharacterized protein n=1 Tax=Dryococelus australis TaxID=614101 RepID=A0ABQ9HBE8_9NEOP|nr:hypothetical protein PR048_018059 [Dryococelus australis]